MGRAEASIDGSLGAVGAFGALHSGWFRDWHRAHYRRCVSRFEPATAAADPRAGEQLRLLLQRAALTPEQFAHRLNRLAAQTRQPARVHPKTPYKWLRGEVPREPWPTLAPVVLSQRLNTAVHPSDIGWRVPDTGLVFVPATAGLEVPWTGAGAIQSAFDVAETNIMDRRVFLQVTGGALTQPALEWLIARPATDIQGSIGRRVLNAHVDGIEQMTAQLRRMDDELGGGAVLDLVKSQVRFVLDLLRDHQYTTQVGMRLHGAAAELLRLAGWLSFDTGQHAQAQRFWVSALHGAHSAGDRALGSNILGFMSCQAKDLELYSEAINLAEAARQGYPGGSPRVTAILDLRVAEARAQLADTTETRAAIDNAYEALRATAADGGEPEWSYWMDEAHASGQAGYCYTRLSDWPRAQHHLTTALRMHEDSYNREGALQRALLAITYAHQGEPEEACRVANRAIDILADDVDSERCIGHIRRVQDAVAPYRRVPAVRELRERIDQVFGLPM
jgi:hypothetical protein